MCKQVFTGPEYRSNSDRVHVLQAHLVPQAITDAPKTYTASLYDAWRHTLWVTIVYYMVCIKTNSFWKWHTNVHAHCSWLLINWNWANLHDLHEHTMRYSPSLSRKIVHIFGPTAHHKHDCNYMREIPTNFGSAHEESVHTRIRPVSHE